mgnify:CR=1 FL=1
MRLIKPYYVVESILTPDQCGEMLQLIERAGRTCKKSEEKITNISYYSFIEDLIARGHESVLEHEKITVRFICDRGISHELVRHRIASFSQESTRYCNYTKDKFEHDITFIIPCWLQIEEGYYNNKSLINDINTATWIYNCVACEEDYFRLINDLKWTPQQARSVLTN